VDTIMESKEQIKALERQRLRAGRMLLKGKSQAEVAREIGVARSTVCGWHAKVREGGLDALRSTGLRGRPASLSDADLKSLKKVLVAGPLASGFATDVWTLPRVRRVVADQFGVKLSESQIWRVLRKMGFSPQRPSKRALQRDDKAAKEWKTKHWPALKKTPKNRGV
jgi:transposase